MHRVALIVLAAIVSGSALPLEDFYPFGTSAGDNLVGPTLDGSSPQVFLSTPLLFFGATFTNLYVRTNFYDLLLLVILLIIFTG